MKKVLILGGYGNFGQRISEALVKASVPIIIAGRHQKQAEKLQQALLKRYQGAHISTAVFDVDKEWGGQLAALKPTVVINTCGPFQLKNYGVAETCIKHNVHYIDLSDGRDFVTGITALDARAKAANVMVISGVSTVPGLTSAVIEKYRDQFLDIDSLTFGISPGQKAPRGLATTKSILTYLGKPLKPFPGGDNVYGWQDLHRVDFPQIGKRWMANCDVPDLDLLPEHYGIKKIRFSAGMESRFLHFGMWVMSWCVRLGLPLNLPAHAKTLLRMSHWFDVFGTPDGGMYVTLRGKDQAGNPHEMNWFIVGLQGDGPQIPCVPAIVLAKKMIAGDYSEPGARACVGLITLDDYMNELSGFVIEEITI